mmetsp:Transcript_10369/g.34329  ORF Transcript_10369/g.34329 Transcript_10369/m.34329 type:complete len:99 (+) Transcript_10369:975-1271(+)
MPLPITLFEVILRGAAGGAAGVGGLALFASASTPQSCASAANARQSRHIVLRRGSSAFKRFCGPAHGVQLYGRVRRRRRRRAAVPVRRCRRHARFHAA